MCVQWLFVLNRCFQRPSKINSKNSQQEHNIHLRALVKASGINGGCEQIVGGGDGVNVASQVQVEVFHWNHLGVAATRSATWKGNCDVMLGRMSRIYSLTLDAEGGSLAWLTHARKDVFVQMGAECLGQANGGGAFPFAQRSGRNTKQY